MATYFQIKKKVPTPKATIPQFFLNTKMYILKILKIIQEKEENSNVEENSDN